MVADSSNNCFQKIQLIGGDILNRNAMMPSFCNTFYGNHPASLKVFSLWEVSPFGEGKPDVG